ncbi:membrane protein US12C [macacine betaherpesvirus 3]|nr:Rh195 [macacine betaherpesvirus 3]QQL10482.1 Rh195 [macacine betaherpesvirus 3]QQL10664.1 Rh195 [Rhesus cytomegalovirus strain 68-1.2]QQL10848.1 Rh195 [Rhesus cytomegalovirus strain 68-1_FL]APT40243.1 Rh195 [macacine betaherpesvirus 3]
MERSSVASISWLQRTNCIFKIYGCFTLAVVATVLVYGLARFTFPMLYNNATNCRVDPAPSVLFLIPVVLFMVSHLLEESVDQTSSWIYSVTLTCLSTSVFHLCTNDHTIWQTFVLSLLLFCTYGIPGICLHWIRPLAGCFITSFAVAFSLIALFSKNLSIILRATGYAIFSLGFVLLIPTQFYLVHRRPERIKSSSLQLYTLFIVLYQVSIFCWTKDIWSANVHNMFSVFRSSTLSAHVPKS